MVMSDVMKMNAYFCADLIFQRCIMRKVYGNLGFRRKKKLKRLRSLENGGIKIIKNKNDGFK